MVLGGGDSLEENFVIDSDDSASVSSDDSNINFEFDSTQVTEGIADSSEAENHAEPDKQPAAKKPKLNWREGAVLNDGSIDSQSRLLNRAYEAFAHFFPKDDLIGEQGKLQDANFVDCREFSAQENKSVREMLRYLATRGFSAEPPAHGPKKLSTIFVTGSATRAMYLVKELREMDSKLAPLPLFFHGGGRKKEQALTHESVLRGNKTSVAVCLPSRLLSVCESGLIDFDRIDLVVFDLKTNEKKLNVLSQKETLRDVFQVLVKYALGQHRTNLKFALL